MHQKFVTLGFLAVAFILAPVRSIAAPANADSKPTTEIESADQAISTSDAMEAKFKKLQKEMEGSAKVSSESGTKGGETKKSVSPTVEPTSIFSLSVQILFGLIFVILLAVITIRVLKKLQGRMLSKPSTTARGEFFEVLETCHLGTNQRVVALRINEDVGVIGISPQGITLLTVIKQSAAEVRETYGRESNSAAFSENLNKLLDRFKKPKRVSDLLDEAKA
jgi:flagellar biogenesis protein FliO